MSRPMTREGYNAIQAEIERLWHIERPDVVAQVSAAAELGDRSENAEYIYGKKRLREIDSRMRYLRGKISDVQVVDLEKQPTFPDVRFGAQLVVEDEEGEEKTWRLVDKEESDPARGRISVQSPIGRALLGKRAGDAVEITLPKGKVAYEILSVRYGAGEP
jgi:transcription elongation factor GreB